MRSWRLRFRLVVAEVYFRLKRPRPCYAKLIFWAHDMRPSSAWPEGEAATKCGWCGACMSREEFIEHTRQVAAERAREEQP